MCPQPLSAPGSWLPEGCSPSSPHRQLDLGSAHREHLEPGEETLVLQAIMQSDERVLSFSKTTPLEEAFPRGPKGNGGMGGNPWSLCGQKRLAQSCSLDPSLPVSYFDLTGFQGASSGQAYKMCLQWFRAPWVLNKGLHLRFVQPGPGLAFVPGEIWKEGTASWSRGPQQEPQVPQPVRSPHAETVGG